MPTYKQTNLGGGVLRHELHGRTDMTNYNTFVARLENMYVTPTAQLVNRPGTFVGIPALGDGSGLPSRLIPFVFSNDQAYVIELTNAQLRVIRDETEVQVISGCPWIQEDIWTIKYVQSGDIIWLAHPSFPVQKLMRTAPLGVETWTLAEANFNRVTSPPTGLAFGDGTTGSDVLDQAGDATHAVKEWQWVVTAWSDDESDESSASDPLTPPNTGKIVVADDKPVKIKWTAVEGVTRYSIYRGRNGEYGYVGDAIGQTTFRDDGQTPVISDRPPKNRNPFIDSENPAVVTFVQARLGAANTPQGPAWIYLTQTGNYDNFDYQEPQKDDDSIDFGLACREYEEIRNLFAVDSFLVAMTNVTEWVISGKQGPLYANDLINPRPQTRWGSSWLDVIQIGEATLFQCMGGYPIRGMSVSKTGDVSSADLCTMSGATSSDSPIVSWCYQRRPHRLVWGCDSDGRIWTMTFDQEMKVAAWAKHELLDARVRSVVCIPEGARDVVYMCVERNSTIVGDPPTFWIERLAERMDDQPMNGSTNNYMDAAYVQSGYNTEADNRLTITGTLTVGGTVTVTAEKATFTSGWVTDANRVVLHPFSPEHRVSILVTGYTSPTVVTGTVETGSVVTADPFWSRNPLGLAGWSEANPYDPYFRLPLDQDQSLSIFPPDKSDWGKGTLTATVGDAYPLWEAEGWSGLSAQERLDVASNFIIKLDGVSYTDLGSMLDANDSTLVTFPSVTVSMSIGKPYSMCVETLDVPFAPGHQSGMQGPDMTLNRRAVIKAAFQVDNTGLGFQVGESVDGDLVTWTPEPGENLDYRNRYHGLVHTPIFNTWDRSGRMALVSEYPAPITISALIRELTFGET